jgi:hypothetical protein
MRRAVVIGCLALLAPVVGAQSKPAPPQHKKTAPPPASASGPRLALYLGKYGEAKVLAKERNVPILIHIVIEGEAQNDEYREKLLTDKDLITACANVIVILANNGTHPKVAIEEFVDGKKVKREVCARYGLDACSQHQKFWDDVYRDFKEESGEMYCPQTIVLAPDGKVATRINTRAVPPATEVIAAIKDAQTKAGPGLTDAQLEEVKRLKREGQALIDSKSWADALRAGQKLIAITPKSTWADEARKNMSVADAALAAELERISALLVPGTAGQGYKELAEFGKQCAALPIEKEVKARIAKAETAKDIRDEIAAYKISSEADAILREAQQLFDAKQEKKAERIVRRLFAKRYAATPAAAKARELWPDWAKEEDEKAKKT